MRLSTKKMCLVILTSLVSDVLGEEVSLSSKPEASQRWFLLRKIEKKNIMRSIGVRWSSISSSKCIMECMIREQCSSIEFDEKTRMCNAGSWMINTGESALPTNSVFYSRNLCGEGSDYSYIEENSIHLCLYLSDDKLSNSAAQQGCSDRGGLLFMPKNDMALFIFRSKMEQADLKDVWVGLFDRTGNNDFNYAGGQPFIAGTAWWNTIWHHSQPGEVPDRLCVVYNRDWGNIFEDFCYPEYHYACELLLGDHFDT